MVDRDVLSSRLNALEGYLADLRPFAKRSRDEFVRESGLHHLAERLLHLACECVIDIAHHIIADEGYRQPSTYRDAIAVLTEEGVVDDALADRVAAWVGFRKAVVGCLTGCVDAAAAAHRQDADGDRPRTGGIA